MLKKFKNATIPPVMRATSALFLHVLYTTKRKDLETGILPLSLRDIPVSAAETRLLVVVSTLEGADFVAPTVFLCPFRNHGCVGFGSG